MKQIAKQINQHTLARSKEDDRFVLVNHHCIARPHKDIRVVIDN
jgi:hypothetical protein